MRGKLIEDTAQLLGIEVPQLFFRAAVAKGFSNWEEVGKYRARVYARDGEIPTFVKDYCDKQWREQAKVIGEQARDDNQQMMFV